VADPLAALVEEAAILDTPCYVCGAQVDGPHWVVVRAVDHTGFEPWAICTACNAAQRERYQGLVARRGDQRKEWQRERTKGTQQFARRTKTVRESVSGRRAGTPTAVIRVMHATYICLSHAARMHLGNPITVTIGRQDGALLIAPGGDREVKLKNNALGWVWAGDFIKDGTLRSAKRASGDMVVTYPLECVAGPALRLSLGDVHERPVEQRGPRHVPKSPALRLDPTQCLVGDTEETAASARPTTQYHRPKPPEPAPVPPVAVENGHSHVSTALVPMPDPPAHVAAYTRRFGLGAGGVRGCEVELPGGGRVQLVYDVDLFSLAPEDRAWLLALIDRFVGREDA
jgi:hypothetical protein